MDDLNNVRYGGFWKRFWANTIDAIICTFVSLPTLGLALTNKNLVLIFPIFALVFYPVYTIYFNTKKGATLGKQMMGLKILSINLETITFKEAFKRSSVDILLGGLQMIGILLAINGILEGISTKVKVIEMLGVINKKTSSGYHFTRTLENIWLWSEVIVLLFNKKKRALHDYIAKTVVIIEESLPISVINKIYR